MDKKEVTSLVEEKKKRQAKSIDDSDDVKAKRSVIVRNIYQQILGESVNPIWPKFPLDLRVFIDPMGTRIPVEIQKSSILRPLSEEAVINAVLQYSETLLQSFGMELELRISEANDIARRWSANSPIIEQSRIAPVRFLSDPGYCWQRLSFDPEEGECPNFDELFSRMDNARSVLAWIGSIFVRESSRQNYLWIYGTGGQGKSSLAGFLARLLGNSYRAELVPDKSNRFWTSGLVGSRLVCFPDCNETHFVTSSLFKSLTGDDAVKVEFKGKTPVTVNLHCKLMFISNKKPNISGSRADMRRLIYCEILPLSPHVKIISPQKYNYLLDSEAPYFIKKCIDTYHTLVEDHGLIPAEASQESLRDLIDDNELWLENFFNDNFTFVPYLADQKEKPFVTNAYIAELAARAKWTNHHLGKFYEFLERKNPLIMRFRTHKERVILGIQAKVNYKNEDFSRSDF